MEPRVTFQDRNHRSPTAWLWWNRGSPTVIGRTFKFIMMRMAWLFLGKCGSNWVNFGEFNELQAYFPYNESLSSHGLLSLFLLFLRKCHLFSTLLSQRRSWKSWRLMWSGGHQFSRHAEPLMNQNWWTITVTTFVGIWVYEILRVISEMIFHHFVAFCCKVGNRKSVEWCWNTPTQAARCNLYFLAMFLKVQLEGVP